MKKIKVNSDIYVGEDKLATVKEVNDSISDYIDKHPQKEYTAGNNIEISDTGVISSNIDTDTINDVVSDYLTENPPQGSDMIFNKYNSGVKTEIVNTTLKSGYVNDEGTLTVWGDTYSYSEKFPVKQGDIITVDATGTDGVTPQNNMPIRFGCAYADDTPVKESGWTTAVTTYTVPSGINYMVITLDTKNYANHVIKKKTAVVTTVFKDELNSPLVQSKVYGSAFLSANASNVMSSNQLILEKNSVSKNKVLSFECNVSSIGSGIIRIGHGRNSYNGSFVEIDSTNITIYKYDTQKILQKQEAHGLTIDGHIMVLIKVGSDNKEHITLHTKSGSYQIDDAYWTGRSGNIFAEADGCDLTDVKLNWYCDDYKKSIYAYGDSYFETSASSVRWTAYLLKNGFDNLLMDHFSGRGSMVAYESFVTSLNHGTPKFALWCIGQNDPDSTTTGINTNWKTATENFINKCLSYGIIPILSTIPNVRGGAVGDSSIDTARTHDYKNDFVKKSGYRYIDFAKAVGAYDSSNWYDGMLSSDGVHPTESGAKALYMQALVDFPELMYNN